MNKLTEQQKIELGRFLYELPLFADESEKGYLKIAISVINKIQELTQNSDKSIQIVENTPTDNTESTRYLLDDDKQHICCVCGQSYPESELERNFMVCDKCKSEGRAIPAREDKNGKLFAAGDWLKNESSSKMVQILGIQPDSIVYWFGSGISWCIPTQDFIEADWIVHERVTTYTGEEYCKFEKDTLIGSSYCLHHCAKSPKGYNEDQLWVICELYNKESYEQSQ